MKSPKTLLWWEKAGRLSTGPIAPQVPRGHRIAVRVAFAAGVTLLLVTAGWIENSRQEPDGAARSVNQSLLAIQSGCGKISEWKINNADVGFLNSSDTITGTRVAYRTVPPSFGKFLPNVVPPKPVAYFPGGSFPVVERLVNNMYRGYVIVFYDNKTPRAQIDAAAAWAGSQPKALVVPWESTRPPFPNGAHFGISTWGVTQTCQQFDPVVLSEFRDLYGPSRAPDAALP